MTGEIICYAIAEINPALNVAVAEDGVAALRWLSKAKEQDALPCLVLLDINMPMLDGKQTLAEIKNDPQLSALPVVVFSTSNNPMDEMFCARYGVELVTKLLTMPQLHQEIKRLLQPCMEG